MSDQAQLLVMILIPVVLLAAEERFITTPALEISNAWRAFALPTGLGLMALTAILQLVSIRKWSVIASKKCWQCSEKSKRQRSKKRCDWRS